MAGIDDFREAEGAHDVTESDGGHVLGNVGHPDAHGGVNGEVCDAGEGLAVLEGGERRLGELKIGRGDEAGRAGDEFPVTDGVGHGSLREKSSGGKGEKQMGEEIAEHRKKKMAQRRRVHRAEKRSRGRRS